MEHQQQEHQVQDNEEQQINNNDPKQQIKILLEQKDPINNLQKPLVFEKNENSNQTVIGVIGETGSGKSTLLNQIQKRLNLNLQDALKLVKFLSKKGGEPVTQKVQSQHINNTYLIDTPGTNDTNKNEFMIFYELLQFLQQQPYNEGISGLIQCVMIDKNQRFKETSIIPMCQIMLSLNLTYPDFNLENAPRLNVMFTNFSKSNNSQYKNSYKDQEYDNSESEEEKQNEDTFEDKIQQYKSLLLDKLYYFMMEKITKEKLKEIIDKILPQSHFYAYIYQIQSEFQQVDQLILDNTNHKRWKIQQQKDFKLLPARINSNNSVQIKVRDIFIQNLDECLDILQKKQDQIQNLINQKNYVLEQLQQDINNIKIWYDKKFKESPWILYKMGESYIEFLKDTVNKLLQNVQEICQNEINKINQEINDYQMQQCALQNQQERERLQQELRYQNRENQKDKEILYQELRNQNRENQQERERLQQELRDQNRENQQETEILQQELRIQNRENQQERERLQQILSNQNRVYQQERERLQQRLRDQNQQIQNDRNQSNNQIRDICDILLFAALLLPGSNGSQVLQISRKIIQPYLCISSGDRIAREFIPALINQFNQQRQQNAINQN